VTDEERQELNRQLFEAVREGDVARVDQLLGAGAEIEATEAEGTTPLHVAAALGISPMVRHLAGRGANINAVNAKGGTTLLLARFAYTLANMAGHTERAARLLDTIRWLRKQGAKDTPGTEPAKWWQIWK